MKRRSNTTAKTSEADAPGSQGGQDNKLFHLASLIENILDAFISTDLEFHVLEWNPAAENMYGWKAAEVLGHPLGKFIQTEYSETTREEALRTILERGIWKGEVTQTHKDGKCIPVLASVSLVKDEKGKPSGFLAINRDITAYKRAEEALKESEERFSTAFFTSPVSQSIIAQGTNEIIAVNDACCRLFGYPREELIGASTAKLNLWEDPADRAVAVQELQNTGHLPPRETTIRTKSGASRTIITAIEPISWKGLPCLISSGFDITERKRAEIERLQIKRLYATLSQVNQIIVRAKDRDELFRGICEVAVQFGELSLAWISLLDEATGNIQPVTSAGLGVKQLQLPQNNIDQDAPSAVALRTSTVRTSENILTDFQIPGSGGHLQESAFRSAAIIPFHLESKPIGVLALLSPEQGVFKGEAALRLLDEMGLDISFALEKMASEARRARAEHDQLRLMRVVEASLNEIYIFDDITLQFTYVNPGALRNLGYTMDELRQMTPVDLKPEITEAAFREMIRPLFMREKDILDFETLHRRKNGTTYPVDVHLQLVETQGSRSFTAIIHDITERKQAEQKLRESEERLRLSLHAANQGLYDLNVQTGAAIVNREYAEMLGYDPETFVETNAAWIERLHPDDRDATATVYSDYINGLLPEYRVEFRQRMKDGNWKWLLSLGRVIEYDAEGKPLRMLGTHTDITERKQAEDAIKLSEARYRSLVETQADIVARSDTSGTLTFANDSYCQRFGISRAQAIGMNFTSTVFPEDLPAILETREALYRPPYRKYVETRNLTSQGVRWFGWDNSAVRDEKGNIIEFQGVGHDITERRQAEERIKTQLERLASLRAIDTAIVSSTDLAMTFYILLTQALTRLKVDAAAVLLLNPVTNELEVCAQQGFYLLEIRNTRVRMGKDIAGRCALENAPLEDHFLTKEDFTFLAPALREEGFTCYIAMPLVNKSKVLGVLEIFEREHHHHDQDWLDFLEALVGQAAIAIDNFQLFDGLQRSNAMLERRVSERTHELHQTNAELKHANHTKNEFLATMSHELRTPLNSILGLSESLLEQRRGTLNENQQRSLQIIETSGRHLLELINDILDLSKIDAGKFDVHPQTIEVNALCQSALALVRQQAVQKSISLTYEEDQTVSKFQADTRRMKQILVNLLTNAIKFTPREGSVILRVQANAEQDLIQFSVIDNGIGIAREDLKDLFQPFVQVDSSLNRQFEGTGLGLALVQKLTDLHGGSVSVESEIGRGSRFTINLPWQKEAVEMEEAATSGTGSKAPTLEGKPAFLRGQAGRPVILLAEDNPANILTVGDYLESHGYEIVIAHNGWQAISKAEEIRPSIILMDIQMPSLDGFEATRHLRANPRFAATPIIALTALAMPGDRERCLEAGANEYLSKPVSLKMLVKTIEKMLEPGRDKSQ